ncbi:Indole-3-glycerol phosphate synthase [Candidatus Magnetomoraceae bacterium gMMP-15]
MSILDKILKKKLEEVTLLKAENDLNVLQKQAMQMPICRDFAGALKNCPHVPIIAEIKRASPSKGPIRESVDVAELAKMYKKGGASAISVLTDKPFFEGSLDDLKKVRQTVDLPVLRKDFIIDEIQIYQARTAGADAVLLIVAALETDRLKQLFNLSLELGMTPLVEVHNESELKKALKLDPPVIGINNRNLNTLEISLETSIKLRPLIPSSLVVGESGIKKNNDILRLLDAKINAFLIGTSLMKSTDPMRLLNELCHAGDKK